MEQDLESNIRKLLANQNCAVLATSENGRPYTSLIAFAASDDLRRLLFVTARATRKFTNLRREPHVSLLLDNRKNCGEDFRDAMAVTVLGVAGEVPDAEQAERMNLFLERHPLLQEFAASPSCALLEVKVQRYILVSRFQNVMELVFES